MFSQDKRAIDGELGRVNIGGTYTFLDDEEKAISVRPVQLTKNGAKFETFGDPLTKAGRYQLRFYIAGRSNDDALNLELTHVITVEPDFSSKVLKMELASRTLAMGLTVPQITLSLQDSYRNIIPITTCNYVSFYFTAKAVLLKVSPELLKIINPNGEVTLDDIGIITGKFTGPTKFHCKAEVNGAKPVTSENVDVTIEPGTLILLFHCDFFSSQYWLLKKSQWNNKI